MSTLKTAGDLRNFLADTLVGIRDGKIGASEATAIAKVSAQINQSLQVEVATRLQMREQGNEPAGGMLLGAPEPEAAALPAPPPPAEIVPVAQPVSAKPVQFTPPRDEKIWCTQCEMRVTVGQAVGCKSKHCAAKAVA